MKIAFVYDVIYPYVKGGIEKRVWELAWRLAQRGHDVTVFGMKYWEGDNVIYKEGVRLWGVCPPKNIYVNDHRSVSEAVYFAWRILPILIRERYDVVDCQNFPYFPCFSAKIAATIKRSQLIVTWHEVWNDYWYEYLGKKGFFGKRVEKIVSKIGGKIIANSEATQRDLRAIGVNKEITLIPNGVNTEKSKNIIPSVNSSDVIFSGRLLKEKKVDLLIKAINHVKKDMSNIKCTIIGEGPETDNLRRLICALNLESNISLKGFVKSEEQVFSLMKASKVFVLPSVREGFGLAFLEANACGIPVITVNHPQNASRDFIVEGENGFVCDVSEKDIADKISRVLNGSNHWEKKCTELAQGYDWNIIVNKLEETYKAE